MENKKNYAELDLLKTIAIFFVLLYHNPFSSSDILSFSSVSTYFNYFIKSILSCCVPLFFFINGALLLNKSFDLKKHIRKIIISITLTLGWGIISLLLTMLIRNKIFSPSEFIFGVLEFKQGWINHLWFLAAIVVIYIFLPLIKFAYDHKREYFYFFLIVVSILTFGNKLLSSCVNIIQSILNVHYFPDKYNFFTGFNAFRGIFGFSLGYFMIGGLCLAKKENSNKRKMLLFLFSLFLYQ